MATMLDKLDPVIERYHEIEESMGDPSVAADFEHIQALARERASLENLVHIGGEYKDLVNEIDDLEALLGDGSDPELAEMAKLGMSDAQVLRSSTTVAADLLGVSSELGTVEVGKIADLVVWEGESLDVSDMRSRVSTVIQGGAVAI